MHWKTTILPTYEIRKSREQKNAFIEMLRKNYGGALTVEESRYIGKAENIIIGDPEKAKIVFTAHYDTCARLPFPNFITPKNPLVYIVYQIILAVVMLIPAFGLTLLTAVLSKSLPEFVALVLTELMMFAVVGFELWWMLAGPENKHTANDNTSGIVTVLTLADKLGFDDYAYILFDKEEMGLLGSTAFAKQHPNVKNNTLIVNFDCVSDGDNMLMAFSKAAQSTELYAKISENADRIMGEYGKTPVVTSLSTTIYPSDQQVFRKSAAVASLKRAKFIGLYMDRIHTANDTVFMEDNINALVKLFSEAAQDEKQHIL